jgi:hypothetical protein
MVMGAGETVDTGLVVTVTTVSWEPEPHPAAQSATAVTRRNPGFTIHDS